jgi:hypothetical protein
MKIGIIGSGDVAQSLGKGLVASGNHVMLGSRHPSKKELAHWHKLNKEKALTGSTTEAANYGQLVILAIAWHAAEDVLQQIRPELAGKVIVDVTNPLVFNDDEAPTLSFGYNMSGGEVVQQSLPDSHVVKTLNTISHNHMVNPSYKSGQPTMFLCGNNNSAKKEVADLLKELKWSDIVDIGDISKSRLLEPLALLWLEFGVARKTWDHAFAVLSD